MTIEQQREIVDLIHRRIFEGRFRHLADELANEVNSAISHSKKEVEKILLAGHKENKVSLIKYGEILNDVENDTTGETISAQLNEQIQKSLTVYFFNKIITE